MGNHPIQKTSKICMRCNNDGLRNQEIEILNADYKEQYSQYEIFFKM
jgi:hypothetical protein